jgi:hypothetical protein
MKHSNFNWTGKFDEHARSVMAGIRHIDAMVRAKTLFADKVRCPQFCQQMRNYRWDERHGTIHDAELVFADKPADNQRDDAIAAGRYAITYATKPPLLRPMTGGERLGKNPMNARTNAPAAA